MKTLKKNLFFSLVAVGFNLSWSALSRAEESFMGMTTKEAHDFENCIDISETELNSPRTVSQFIAQCAHGVYTSDDCRLNIESTCINGQEVQMIDINSSDFKETIANSGFDARPSRGLTQSDFSDGGKRMYNKVDLGDGRTAQLCNQVKDFTPGPGKTVDSNRMNLPVGTVIESDPSILKAQSGIGGTSIHTTSKVVRVDNQDKYIVEMELRPLHENKAATVRGETAPYKVVSDSFTRALSQMINLNFVRCKKERYLTDDSTGKTLPIAFLDSSLPDRSKQAYLGVQEKFYGKGNPTGLNVDSARASLGRVFGMSSDALVTAPVRKAK
jgi:hypothetical protein